MLNAPDRGDAIKLVAVDAPALAPARAPDLVVVIPVLNERENVPLVVARLNRVLAGITWEAIFVDDDSPDGTADVVRALSRQQPNIRVLQRHPRQRRTLCRGDGRGSAAR
jgi:dolichol-phosphate mannosyltransferase